jgi:two-component system, NtrC family, response regulator HydG
MNPKLIILTGSKKGMIFALGEEEVVLGREASCFVRIIDVSVSRRHCLIRKIAGQFQLHDLDSFNGTFVNGVPVKEQVLEHGDQIAVGDVLLLFLARDEGTEGELESVQINEEDLNARSTIQLQRKDALYLQPEKLLHVARPAARLASDLNSLLKISMAINSIRDLQALQKELLESILDVIPAERGAILLVKEHAEEFISAFGWNRASGREKTVSVSRTVAQRVLHEGIAILSNDVEDEPAFGVAESLIRSRVRALLCVPLAIFEKVFGLIYLDTSDARKPFDEDHLQLLTAIAAIASVALENIHKLEWLKGENKRLYEELKCESSIIGESEAIRKIYQLISKLAPTDSTVLIRGESGTGKELAARALHLNSSRASMPFVAINCATLSDQLFESELFGHEKGAFTGAIAQKKGKLEVAEKGTIFLDEVGELPLSVQAKLLRALQEREFERVGGTRTIKVDVRLIAATNKDLGEAVGGGTFRKDLYYRLNVVSFMMPPLRERREDIPLLASHFLAKYSKKCKRKVIGISPEARGGLINHDWEGNVRELENAIERAVVLGTTEFISLEDLPENITEGQQTHLTANKYYKAIKETKREIILQAIEEAAGNYTEAAKTLGIHPNNLHRLIRTLNLKQVLQKL